jgi:hypothetical protein
MNRDNDLIGPMAAFIGARLQYPCPHINGQGNPWVSTIHVEQHKEKFFAIRVYCTLAEQDLVKKKWEWLRDRAARMAAGEKFYDRLHNDVIRSKLTTDEAPPAEFVARCLKHDAIHYRKVYLEMVQLQPHLVSKICGSADHTELLYPQYEELAAYLDKQFVYTNNFGMNWLLKKYGVDDVEALKAYLKVIYNPSVKDSMELRD